MLEEPTTDRMSCFVMCYDLFLFRRDQFVSLFKTSNYPVKGIMEIIEIYFCFTSTCSNQCGLVTHIRDIRTCKSRSHLTKDLRFYRLTYLYIFQMPFEDRFSTSKLRTLKAYLSIETPGTHQRTIENIRTVCCRHD